MEEKQISQRVDDDYMTLCSTTLAYTNPNIYRGFLKPEECLHILHLARIKGMSASTITGCTKDPSRKSKTCWLKPQDDALIGMLLTRLSLLLDVEESALEPLQVVYYCSGDYFDLHYDQCFLTQACCKKEMERFDQRPRTRTFLLYLNHPWQYSGGETTFPLLGMQYKLEEGSALLFYNLDNSRRYVHPKSIHAGAPVLGGEKWVANIWIRDAH